MQIFSYSSEKDVPYCIELMAKTIPAIIQAAFDDGMKNRKLAADILNGLNIFKIAQQVYGSGRKYQHDYADQIYLDAVDVLAFIFIATLYRMSWDTSIYITFDQTIRKAARKLGVQLVSRWRNGPLEPVLTAQVAASCRRLLKRHMWIALFPEYQKSEDNNKYIAGYMTTDACAVSLNFINIKEEKRREATRAMRKEDAKKRPIPESESPTQLQPTSDQKKQNGHATTKIMNKDGQMIEATRMGIRSNESEHQQITNHFSLESENSHMYEEGSTESRIVPFSQIHAIDPGIANIFAVYTKDIQPGTKFEDLETELSNVGIEQSSRTRRQYSIAG